MDVDALEQWLKSKPRPKHLRIHVADGQPREIKLRPGSTWAPVAKTVMALDPLMIEALDDGGGTIRAITPEDEQVTDAPAPAPPSPQFDPTVLMAPPTDPESVRFILVARLIADAYRHSQEVAFARMVDLFESVNAQRSTMERTLDHLAKLLRKEVEARVNSEPADDGTELLGAIAQGMMFGGQQPQGGQPPPTNGKG